MGKFLLSTAKAIISIIVLNLLAGQFHYRFDLTEDGRYTLSDPAAEVAQRFGSPVVVDILLGGDLPAEFARLRSETVQLLESFASKNDNIKYNLVDPLGDPGQAEQSMAQLQGLGLQPASVTVEENGKVSNELVFPWAMVNHGERTVKVPLLKNRLGSTAEERINNSVQQLEYAFADAFTKLSLTDKKSIAVLKGNGQLEDLCMADYLGSIRDYYNIGPITLDSVATDPQKVLDQLKTFDMVLIAKPTHAFDEGEKYVLDQFMVQGGKSLWLVDRVAMEMDSIHAGGGSALALPRELNLADLFFSYGLRIEPLLVNDLYFTQIVLASGEGNDSQYNPLPWYYYPMVFSRNDHPINANIEALRLQFTSPIALLGDAYQKTVLLASSPLSKPDGVPGEVSLEMINVQPDRESYNKGNMPLAVLVEGAFTSMYRNRVKPLKLQNVSDRGPANKMILISDGDAIKNQLSGGRPLELGYDKWTNSFYGNKEFLLNATNYLLDDTGLLDIRNKRVSIPLLDAEKIVAKKGKWTLLNIGLPLALTLLLGLGFNGYRKHRFAR